MSEQKALRVLAALAALFALWNALAGAYVTATNPKVNGDKVPDLMRSVTAEQLAREVGITGAYLPVVQVEAAASDVLTVVVEGFYRGDALEPHLNLKVVGGGVTPQKITLPYSHITWETASVARMDLVFRPGVITVPYTGDSQSYGRFLTFGGADSYSYAGSTSVRTIIVDCTQTVKIAVPDTPTWRALRAFG